MVVPHPSPFVVSGQWCVVGGACNVRRKARPLRTVPSRARLSFYLSSLPLHPSGRKNIDTTQLFMRLNLQSTLLCPSEYSPGACSGALTVCYPIHTYTACLTRQCQSATSRRYIRNWGYPLRGRVEDRSVLPPARRIPSRRSLPACPCRDDQLSLRSFLIGTFLRRWLDISSSHTRGTT